MFTHGATNPQLVKFSRGGRDIQLEFSYSPDLDVRASWLRRLCVAAIEVWVGGMWRLIRFDLTTTKFPGEYGITNKERMKARINNKKYKLNPPKIQCNYYFCNILLRIFESYQCVPLFFDILFELIWFFSFSHSQSVFGFFKWWRYKIFWIISTRIIYHLGYSQHRERKSGIESEFV